MLLEKRTAIVTGAGGGIGKAIAIGMAAVGASVVVNDIDEKNARKTSEEIGERGGASRYFICDVSDYARSYASSRSASRPLAPWIFS